MFFRKFSTYDRADGVDDIITWQIVYRCDLCRKFLFVLYYSTSEMINVPKNRMNPEIKILHLSLVNAENNPNIADVSRIHIGKIRLFLKNLVTPLNQLLLSLNMWLNPFLFIL